MQGLGRCDVHLSLFEHLWFATSRFFILLCCGLELLWPKQNICDSKIRHCLVHSKVGVSDLWGNRNLYCVPLWRVTDWLDETAEKLQAWAAAVCVRLKRLQKALSNDDTKTLRLNVSGWKWFLLFRNNFHNRDTTERLQWNFASCVWWYRMAYTVNENVIEML